VTSDVSHDLGEAHNCTGYVKLLSSKSLSPAQNHLAPLSLVHPNRTVGLDSNCPSSICQVGTCEASRFDSNSTVMGRFENFRIGRVCPLLVVVRRLKSLTALSGRPTVYRLASSVSDHTPVLFKNWNEESVVQYISFVSFVINYRLLSLIFVGVSIGLTHEMSYTADSIRYSIRTQTADWQVPTAKAIL